jgi:cytidine deaminase
MTDDKLVRRAMDAKEMAYAPYSGFRVGAALLTKNGSVYLGCNVENGSYGLSICAERVAIGNALSVGESEFETLVVATDSEDFISPCGACRQVIWEFAKELRILLANVKGEVETTNIRTLFPSPFTPNNLGQP